MPYIKYSFVLFSGPDPELRRDDAVDPHPTDPCPPAGIYIYYLQNLFRLDFSFEMILFLSSKFVIFFIYINVYFLEIEVSFENSHIHALYYLNWAPILNW